MGNILIVDEAALPTARAALEAQGHACFQARGEAEAETALQKHPIDVLLSPIHASGAGFEYFDLAQRRRPNCRGVAVLSDGLEEYFPRLLIRAFPHNFLADNQPIDPAELVATVEKLLHRDIFGIEKYEVEARETVTLRSTDEKYPLIERVREFYLSQGISERVVRNVELILDELLMNAFFNAPLAAGRLSPYRNREREEKILFPEEASPVVAYGIGPSRLALSVSDPFGSLSQETFFSYVHRCFSEKSVLEGTKGAGMGLFLVFKSLDQLVINVASGRKTEVIALIDPRTSLGELKKRRHSFHYFQIDEAEPGKKESIHGPKAKH